MCFIITKAIKGRTFKTLSNLRKGIIQADVYLTRYLIPSLYLGDGAVDSEYKFPGRERVSGSLPPRVLSAILGSKLY